MIATKMLLLSAGVWFSTNSTFLPKHSFLMMVKDWTRIGSCISSSIPFSLGVLAVGLISEALDEGDTRKTLQALQVPAAKLEGVTPKVGQHYQGTLLGAKREKAQVGVVESTSPEAFASVY